MAGSSRGIKITIAGLSIAVVVAGAFASVVLGYGDIRSKTGTIQESVTTLRTENRDEHGSIKEKIDYMAPKVELHDAKIEEWAPIVPTVPVLKAEVEAHNKASAELKDGIDQIITMQRSMSSQQTDLQVEMGKVTTKMGHLEGEVADIKRAMP